MRSLGPTEQYGCPFSSLLSPHSSLSFKMEKPHKRLEVWKKSMDLVTEIYRVTEGFPPEERFGLVKQMRRSAVSVPSNLAEGAARKGNGEFIQFLHMSMGSLSELDTQLEISRRLSFLTESDLARLGPLLSEVDKMLVGLRNHLLNKGTAEQEASWL